MEAKPELPFDVYRLDPKSGIATVATTSLVKRPNGLAFSPDEAKLYVPVENIEVLSRYGSEEADAQLDRLGGVAWQSRKARVKERIKPLKPRRPDAPDGTWRMSQREVDRVQEFRKCIECFLCQDVCHVLRDHGKHEEFAGPRHFVYAAALEMHPLDVGDRISDLRGQHGIGYCNITKCCTRVCPEHITITDNAIIPLKERVVDEFYDPIGKLVKIFSRRKRS